MAIANDIKVEYDQIYVDVVTLFGLMELCLWGGGMTASFPDPPAEYLRVNGVPVRGYVAFEPVTTLAGTNWKIAHKYVRRTDRWDKTELSWAALGKIEREVTKAVVALVKDRPELLMMASERSAFRAAREAHNRVVEARKALSLAEAEEANTKEIHKRVAHHLMAKHGIVFNNGEK